MNLKPILAAVALIGIATHAFAANLLDEVKSRGSLRIAVEGTYPPFNYKDTSGQLVGFDVEIAKALAAKLGVKPEFTTTEWSGILAGLQAGKFDVIVNQVAITPKRLETFDFSAPYVVSSPQLIVRQNEERGFKGLEDLRGKKLGVGQGSNYADLAKSVEGIEVKTYPGAPEYLADLAQGRINAALNDSLLIPYLVKEAKLPLKPGAPVGQIIEMGIPFRKDNPQFKAALDQALAAIKADGSYATLSVQWFGRDVSKAPTAQ